MSQNSSVENLTETILSNVTGNRVTVLSQLELQPFYQLGMNLVKCILPIIITVGTLGNLTSFIIMVRRESGFKTLIHIYTGFELLHVHIVSCKLVHFFVHLRAKWSTIGIAVMCVLIDLHIFWTAELIESKKTINPDNLMCSAYTYKFFAGIVFAWINLAISSFIPFIVLLIFNILIIIGLL